MDNRRNIAENAEYGVDSRYRSSEERKEETIALMQARLERIKNLSREQIIKVKLLQLKLKMKTTQ